MSDADGKDFDPNELQTPGDDMGQDDPLAELGQPDDFGTDAITDLGGELDELPEGTEPPAELGAAASEEDQPAEADLGALPEEAEASEEPAEESVVAQQSWWLDLETVDYAVFGVCGLSILVLLVLDVAVFMGWGLLLFGLMNLFWLIGTAIPLLLWMGRETNNFFEVMLGISLAGILIALMLLLAELVSYGGSIGATG